MALIKLMLEQMQQDIAILKSKDASNNGAFGNSQRSNNPVIQLGTIPTIPNMVSTIGKTPTVAIGISASSTFITEERL